MKVATFTFHSACNYGAMLQAYALPQAIQTLGHECEIIDYRNPAYSKEVEIEWPSQLVRRYGVARGIIKTINRWKLGIYNRNNRYVQYALFMKHMLPLSATTYRTINELSTTNYDAVVFGSDQIWNEALTGGYTPEYYGAFINDTVTRKIAYAASSGEDRICSEHCDEIGTYLKSFSSLGLREQGLTEFLREEWGVEGKTVVDPVLLLKKKEWEAIAGKLPKGTPPRGKYIFIYTFDEQPVYDFARKLSKETGLPMVLLRWCGANQRFSDMIQFSECSPQQFLALIQHAAYICTSSFHGTAFSVIFEKEFYCCAPHKYSSRTRNLMDMMGITGHQILDNPEAKLELAIDYYDVATRREHLRTESLNFLKCALD